jgi:hypothetical protein
MVMMMMMMMMMMILGEGLQKSRLMIFDLACRVLSVWQKLWRH